MLIALVAVSFAAFSSTLTSWFQEDDYVLLRRVALGGPFGTWSHAPSQFFRPVVSLSFWAQYHLFGDQPFPFRVFNVGFHAGVGFLIYRLVREMLPTSRHGSFVALISALLFALHPSHAEPVQWIASRTDLVATFFGLLSLLLFVRYAHRQSHLGLIPCVIAFLVGLLSKESVVVIPAIAAAYVVCVRPASFPWSRSALGFGSVLALYLAVRIASVGLLPNDGLVRSGGVKLMGSTFAQIVRCLFPGLPVGDPTLNNAEALRTAPGLAFLGIGLLVVAALGWRAWKSDLGKEESGGQRFLLAAFALSQLPAAGLSVRLFRCQGERFLYLPSAFFLAWAVLVLLAPGSKPMPNRLKVALLVTTTFFLLQWQNLLWRDGAQLSRRVSLSIANDVVPNARRNPSRILLLNAPARVHGSYAAFYVLGEIARTGGLPKEVQTEAVLAMQLVRLPHRVACERTGPYITLSIGSEDGVFVPEDTFFTQSPSKAALRAKGLVGLRPGFAKFDTRAFPVGAAVFYWDGERFRLLPNLEP